MGLIGLSGYARSGKDEAAKILVEEFGFKRVAFADKLREVLYQLNPIVNFDVVGKTNIYVQDVIDEWGWDGHKETAFGPEIRRLLQRLGTEAGRQTLWDNIWVDAALTGHDEDASIVVTDCRFPNEAQAIVERGGKVFRIKRPGVGPAVGVDGTIHKSETSLDDWIFDGYIINDGTLEDYRVSVRQAARFV